MKRHIGGGSKQTATSSITTSWANTAGFEYIVEEDGYYDVYIQATVYLSSTNSSCWLCIGVNSNNIKGSIGSSAESDGGYYFPVTLASCLKLNKNDKVTLRSCATGSDVSLLYGLNTREGFLQARKVN